MSISTHRVFQPLFFLSNMEKPFSCVVHTKSLESRWLSFSSSPHNEEDFSIFLWKVNFCAGIFAFFSSSLILTTTSSLLALFTIYISSHSTHTLGRAPAQPFPITENNWKSLEFSSVREFFYAFSQNEGETWACLSSFSTSLTYVSVCAVMAEQSIEFEMMECRRLCIYTQLHYRHRQTHNIARFFASFSSHSTLFWNIKTIEKL